MSLVEYLHETNKEKRAILNTFLSPQFGYFLHAWMKHVRVLTKERKNITRREKCPYSEFFWSVFSRIRIEYGMYGKNFYLGKTSIWTILCFPPLPPLDNVEEQ